MSELDNYPRPWRVTTTGKQRRTGGGYNYHIRAANDMYVAEKLMGGIAVATIIIEGVNEREERDRLRSQLAETEQRAEAAERERDGFQAWANTLESLAWQDAGFCPHCGADDVRLSTDVLEPDVAQAVRYCCSCKQAWLDAPAQPRV